MPLRFPLGGYTKAAIDTSARLESGHWFAIADGHGWNQFLHTIEVLPRRGDTLPLPLMSALQMTRRQLRWSIWEESHGMV